MPTNYDRIDLRWNWRGDYILGQNMDLADSADDQIQGFIDMVMDVVSADMGDWQEHPSRATSLSEFIGQANTRDTAREIQERVVAALTTNFVVRAQDLSVKVTPIDIHSVLIIIIIAAKATANNSLEPRDPITITLLHDYQERGVMAIGYTGSKGMFPET